MEWKAWNGPWSAEWQMLFNVDKCKVIHAGAKNQCFRYEMGGGELEEVDFRRMLVS